MPVIKELENLRRIPFPDIEVATKNFKTRIGVGGYGPVYIGELSLSGNLVSVAVKRLNINESGQGLKEFLTERQLLSRYKHPNLVSLLGYCEEGYEKILIYEYAERGSFDNYLNPAKKKYYSSLTWKQRMNICVDAARGLDYLHNHVATDHRVIHRDIKSANILINQNWKAMIADLGLSKLGRANENVTYLITNAAGTLGYVDPAYINEGVLTKESDVYSFGVVLFEALCGRLFFMDVPGERRLNIPLAQLCYEKGNLNVIMDLDSNDAESMKEFSSVAYQCLNADQKGRPSMDVVLQKLEKALQLFEIEEASRLQEIEEASRLQEIEEASRLQEFEEACEIQLLEEALGLQKLVVALQTDVCVEAFLLQELDDAMEMQELVEALELHKLGDILELETDYATVKAINKMPGTHPTYTTKEDIYTYFSSGILLDDGKTWFSIDGNGKNQEMISAIKFMHPIPNKCQMITGLSLKGYPTCVFPMFAEIYDRYDVSEVNMQVKIRTQLLSSNVPYAAYLVCKYYTQYSDVTNIEYLRYQLNNQSQSYTSYPRYRYDDEWVMFELFRTNSLKRSVEFKVLLKGFFFYACRAVFVQGIVFLPLQKFDDEKIETEEMENPPTTEIKWKNRLPSDYKRFVYYSGKKMDKEPQNYVITETEEEAYTILSRGIYITTTDDVDLWFWITKSKVKKCFMVLAESLKHDNLGKLKLSHPNESRFKYVLEIKSLPDSVVTFKVTNSILSTNTSYACYLVYKIPQGFDKPVKVTAFRSELSLGDAGEISAISEFLYLSRCQSPVVIGPNPDGADGERYPRNKLTFREVPSKRKDGWLEIRLWKFTTLDKPTTPDERSCSCIPWFSANRKNKRPPANDEYTSESAEMAAINARFFILHTDEDYHFRIQISCKDHLPNLRVQGVEFRPI